MIAKPMTMLESRYLTRHYAISWRWRVTLLLCILPIATIPFHTYITAENVQWLYLMMAVTFGLQVWLWARTVWLAARPLPRLNEDLLILTGIEGGHSVQSRWWAVVRHLWPDYLLVAVARFGVALGLVQIMYIGFTQLFPLRIWNPLYLAWQPPFFRNSSLNCFYLNIESCEHGLYPDAVQGVIAGSLLVVISFSEMGLLAASGTVFQRITRLPFISTVINLIVRFLLIVAISFVIVRASHISSLAYNRSGAPFIELAHCCVTLSRVPVELRDRFNWCKSLNLTPLWILRGAETIEVAASTIFDQGALLSANVMRPLNRNPPVSGWLYTEFGYAYQSDPNPTYWPFVIRNIVSAVIAIVGYAGLTWMLLWAAGRASRRRGYL